MYFAGVQMDNELQKILTKNDMTTSGVYIGLNVYVMG